MLITGKLPHTHTHTELHLHLKCAALLRCCLVTKTGGVVHRTQRCEEQKRDLEVGKVCVEMVYSHSAALRLRLMVLSE